MARAWRKKGQINRWLTALENLRKSISPEPPKYLTKNRIKQVEWDIDTLKRRLKEAGVTTDEEGMTL